MKRPILALVLCLPLLGGCQGLTTTGTAANGTVTQVAPQAMLAAKKSLIAAHALHEGAADALTAAANANLCKGTCASQAKTYLDQSEAGLRAADNLVALGDAPGIEAKIAGATSLISQVQTLLGAK